MYVWKSEGAVVRHVWDIVPINLTDEEKSEAARELHEKGCFRREFVARRKDGSPIDTEVTVSVIRDERGKIYGYPSVDRDISDRKRMERELKEREERFRATFEQAADGSRAEPDHSGTSHTRCRGRNSPPPKPTNPGSSAGWSDRPPR